MNEEYLREKEVQVEEGSRQRSNFGGNLVSAIAILAVGLSAGYSIKTFIISQQIKPEQRYVQGIPKYNNYTAKRGDTLSKISMRYGVPLDELVELNDIENPNIIEVGQVLKIPTIFNSRSDSVGSNTLRKEAKTSVSDTKLDTGDLEKKIEEARSTLIYIRDNSYMDKNEKEEEIDRIKRNYGEDILLKAIRRIPLYDQNSGKFTRIDTWARETTSDLDKDTPFGRDPVGEAFDLLMGNKSPFEFVKENYEDSSSGFSNYGNRGSNSSSSSGSGPSFSGKEDTTLDRATNARNRVERERETERERKAKESRENMDKAGKEISDSVSKSVDKVKGLFSSDK